MRLDPRRATPEAIDAPSRFSAWLPAWLMAGLLAFATPALADQPSTDAIVVSYLVDGPALGLPTVLIDFSLPNGATDLEIALALPSALTLALEGDFDLFCGTDDCNPVVDTVLSEPPITGGINIPVPEPAAALLLLPALAGIAAARRRRLVGWRAAIYRFLTRICLDGIAPRTEPRCRRSQPCLMGKIPLS